MAYYLTIKKKENYMPIDITKLECFKKISKYKSGGLSLEEIDMCTMNFYNEYYFKEALYNSGLIELEDISKEITIRSKRKDTLELVRNGIAYSNSKYYFDITRLKYILLGKQKDYKFLEKLLSYYRNSYINSINISKIKYAMQTKNIELLNITLGEFYMKEISKYDYSTGEVKINYKSFHDLAMFIQSYEIAKLKEENGITKEEDKLERILTLKYLTKSLEDSLPKKEEKKIKRKEIDGQMSIF